ncbi:MAG: hypothetical protein ACRDZM_14675 [Acidimicrobiia bacterium]
MDRLETLDETDPWSDLEVYRQRYDIEDELEQVRSLQRAISRRRARASALWHRFEYLESELAATRQELKAVQSEINGSLRVGALLVEEVLDRVRNEQKEGWSPTPILGFRLWAVEEAGLLGARLRWPGASMTGSCLNRVPGEDIPHSTSRCGPPACGIYATKDLALLHRELGVGEIDGFAFGVVALTGKVVEHQHGYRGAAATAIAVAARARGRHLETDDPSLITSLFDDPMAALARSGVTGAPGRGDADRYLEQWKENHDTWIWDLS